MTTKSSLRAQFASLLVVVCGAAAAKPVVLLVEAQPMTAALNQFVEQSGIQLLYPADSAVEGVRTQGIEGVMTPDAALNQLLAGTGLSYEFVNARTVAIWINNDIPEILVNSSRSPNADIERRSDDINPYVVLSSQEIARSGASNIERLFGKRLATAHAYGRPDSRTIALKVFGNNKTLVLVNQSPDAVRPTGFTCRPTPNGIPLSAIERIEVLPFTASGIFGRGATSGVINIVLKRNYSGIEASAGFDAVSVAAATHGDVCDFQTA